MDLSAPACPGLPQSALAQISRLRAWGQSPLADYSSKPSGMSCRPVFEQFANSLPALPAAPEYDVRSVRWGMSVEEVKKSESMKIAEEGVYDEPEGYQSYIVAYAHVPCAGQKGYLVYSFYENKLFSATYLFFTEEMFFDDLRNASEKVLGPYTKKTVLKSDQSTVLRWNKDKTTVFIISEPQKDVEYG